MTEKEKLIESLRLEVICPAKSRMFLRIEDKSRVLIHGRSDSNDVRTHWKWSTLFSKAGLNLEEELQKLVKSEIGEDYDVVYDHFQSYMHSFTSYEIVRKKSKEVHNSSNSSGSFYGSHIRTTGR